IAYEGKGDKARALIDLRVAARLFPEEDPARADIAGRIAAIESELAAAPAPAPSPTVAPEADGAPADVAAAIADETRIALVIGNSGYQATNPLANPDNDAEAVAAALRQSGFDQVTVVLDADRNGLVEALRSFAAKA